MCTDLPWADCSNPWNTENCRNPYEQSFNESCRLSSEAEVPCSSVDPDYQDCKEEGAIMTRVRNETIKKFVQLSNFSYKDPLKILSRQGTFCEFMTKNNKSMRVFYKNVTDPVEEFWEKKALEQTAGVSESVHVQYLYSVLWMHQADTLGFKLNLTKCFSKQIERVVS